MNQQLNVDSESVRKLLEIVFMKNTPSSYTPHSTVGRKGTLVNYNFLDIHNIKNCCFNLYTYLIILLNTSSFLQDNMKFTGEDEGNAFLRIFDNMQLFVPLDHKLYG